MFSLETPHAAFFSFFFSALALSLPTEVTPDVLSKNRASVITALAERKKKKMWLSSVN